MPGPHDLLFRLTFSRPKLAADQVRAVLPEALTRHLGLAKMRVLPSTFVQPELREFICDVLYEVPFADGRPAQIWLLFEHQSKADHWILLRSLRYMLEAWWAAVIPRSKTAKTITPIIPMLIHHERDWVVPRRFSELYEPLPEELSRAVQPWLVDFGIEVDDLTAQSETDLTARSTSPMLTATLWSLRSRGRAWLRPSEMPKWIQLFEHLARVSMDDLMAILAYYSLVDRRRGREVIEVIRRTASSDLGAQMTNPLVEELQKKIAAEQALQIRAEGEAHGMLRGKTEGKAEALIQVLKLRGFAIDERLRRRITHATIEQLEAWLAQAITADALTDVFQDD